MKKPVKPTIPIPPLKPNKSSLEEVFFNISIHDGISLSEIIDRAKNEEIPNDQFFKLKYEKGSSGSYDDVNSKLQGYIQKEVTNPEYEKRMTAYDLALAVFVKKLTTYKTEKAAYDRDIQLYDQQELKKRLIKEAEELDRLEKLVNQ